MLRGLTSLAPSAHSLPDLALELGLTAWMRFSGTDLETAQATMLTARSAVLEVGEMDSSTEPIPLEDMAADESTSLTQATFDRLQAELEDLTTRGRVEIARAIEAARALGDLSENGDYHAAKDAQGKMESRIRMLQRLLKTATVVDASLSSDGTVAPGTVVTLRYDGDDEDETTDFFVGSIEERQGDLTVVSPGSPLGQALIGHAPGESVEYAAPGGNLRVAIVRIGA